MQILIIKHPNVITLNQFGHDLKQDRYLVHVQANIKFQWTQKYVNNFCMWTLTTMSNLHYRVMGISMLFSFSWCENYWPLYYITDGIISLILITPESDYYDL